MKINVPILSWKFFFRILLCPLVFLWGCFLIAAGLLFPLSIVVCYSFVGLLLEPFVLLFRLCGSEVEGLDPRGYEKYPIIGYFVGTTIPIWGPFAILFYYITTGIVFTGDQPCDF